MRGVSISGLLTMLLLAPGPATAEYQEVAVKNGGTIKGHVRVTGNVPELPRQPVFKQLAVCGSTVPDERLVASKQGELKYAVVYLADVKSGKAVAKDQPVTLDNAKCAFVPHVASASVGQSLRIHNSDPFLHDAHGMLGSQTLFNMAIPKDRTVKVPLAYAGLVHINCNIRHTWMHGYLFIADHPYHAVTDATGAFTLGDVPPGEYTIKVWHELLGEAEQRISVNAGETSTIDIALQGAAMEAEAASHPK